MYEKENGRGANGKGKGRWKAVCYENEGFRQTVMMFENDQNLSRFVWRTAKANGMKEVTLADVEKMLKAADETIFILRGDENGQREFCGNWRKPTWVMKIDRKQMWSAMHIIETVGWAESTLREIEVNGEKRNQRVWTLA